MTAVATNGAMPPEEFFDGPASADEPIGPIAHHAKDWAERMANAGPVRRMQSTISTLNDACRGGLPIRRLIVIGGAPGTGKTSLVAQEAHGHAKRGTPVAIHAVDEGPEGIILRLAQLEGFDSDLLEEGDREEWARAVDAIAKLPILIADDSMTVEQVAEALAAFADGKDAVLVVDSLQKIRAKGTDEADGPRARINCAVHATKRETIERGFLTYATCELSRGAYRSRSAAEGIADIASFKESGDIEYAAQTALVLRSVPGEEATIDVTMPKNRGPRFSKPPFRMRLDRERASFSEIPIEPAASAVEMSDAKRAEIRERVLAAIRTQSGLDTKTKLAKAAGRNYALALEVVQQMIDDQEIALVAGSYRPREVTS